MNKKVQLEILYKSDIKDISKFNKECDYKTMSLFKSIPTKGIFNLNDVKIEYTIQKITVK